MAVTDIALLLIMLIGLRRIRCESGSTYGLPEFLWKQVCLHFSLAMSIPGSIDTFSLRKGIIWILLAAVAEILPAVSPTNSSFPFAISHLHFSL